MTLFERLKFLAEKQGKSINDVENDLGYSKNTLYRLKRSKPGAEKLEEIADYFGVTTDYLLGRSDEPYWKLTEKDEKDIGKELEAILTGIETDTDIAFYGEPMDEETRKLVAMAIENNLRMAKEIAKRKYTPKKYRNED